MLSAGNWEGTVELWDAATARLMRTLKGGGSRSVSFSPDGQMAAGVMPRATSPFGTRKAPDGKTLISGGHGKTMDARYYFFPQDFRYEGEQSIARRGIGQECWQEWFARIPARKSVLLFDTCESGSLTGDRVVQRGLERVVALDRMTQAMGRSVLTASTDDTPALEGYRGHGVFTYALLEAIDQADVHPDGYST